MLPVYYTAFSHSLEKSDSACRLGHSSDPLALPGSNRGNKLRGAATQTSLYCHRDDSKIFGMSLKALQRSYHLSPPQPNLSVSEGDLVVLRTRLLMQNLSFYGISGAIAGLAAVVAYAPLSFGPMRPPSVLLQTWNDSKHLRQENPGRHVTSPPIIRQACVSCRYDFYSIQPANSRLHLTKLPAEHHPFEIGATSILSPETCLSDLCAPSLPPPPPLLILIRFWPSYRRIQVH